MVHTRDREWVCFEADVSQLPPRCHAGYDAQVSALTRFPADRPVCGAREGDAKETRREILDVGVSGCAQAALEESSVEDEDTGEPEEAIDTPDDERWPDVDAAEVGVRMTAVGRREGTWGIT